MPALTLGQIQSGQDFVQGITLASGLHLGFGAMVHMLGRRSVFKDYVHVSVARAGGRGEREEGCVGAGARGQGRAASAAVHQPAPALIAYVFSVPLGGHQR